jgi:hypothetical protein
MSDELPVDIEALLAAERAAPGAPAAARADLLARLAAIPTSRAAPRRAPPPRRRPRRALRRRARLRRQRACVPSPRFPRGALLEERESLRVRTAAARGDLAAAARLRRAFLARWPHSVYRAALESLPGLPAP